MNNAPYKYKRGDTIFYLDDNHKIKQGKIYSINIIIGPVMTYVSYYLNISVVSDTMQTGLKISEKPYKEENIFSTKEELYKSLE